MQIKQVFSTYEGNNDAQPEPFKYCPSCGAQLALKEKGGL